MNHKLIFKSIVALFFVLLAILAYSSTITNKGTLTYKIEDNYHQGLYNYSLRGYYVDSFNRPGYPIYYVITMGEQSTKGYSIRIKNVWINSNNDVRIVVEEKSPSKRSNGTNIFTDSAVYIEFDSLPNSIKIVNLKGEEFNQIN